MPLRRQIKLKWQKPKEKFLKIYGHLETRRNILFASMESKDEKNLIKNLIFSEFYQIERRELGDQIRLREYGVIVMELAKDNFNHYWKQQMEEYEF